MEATSYVNFIRYLHMTHNHMTHNPLRCWGVTSSRPILLITRMITDRIGLHSVLLPLLIDMFLTNQNAEIFACILLK